MTTRFSHAASLIVLLGVCVAEAKAGQIISRFDTDADGWTIVNDGSGSYSSTFGNPAGSFKGVDLQRGGIWYFNAPEKFLGDQSSNYGMDLSYDVWKSHNGDVNRDVWIGRFASPGNPALSLNWFGAVPVAQAWTSHTVTLDTTGGWFRNSDGLAATEDDLRYVLSDLGFLRIRGESNDGPDHAFLDNVVLGAPEPGSVCLLVAGLGTLAMSRLRRRRCRNLSPELCG